MPQRALTWIASQPLDRGWLGLRPRMATVLSPPCRISRTREDDYPAGHIPQVKTFSPPPPYESHHERFCSCDIPYREIDSSSHRLVLLALVE
jgi:hypothetical protein